MLKRNLSIISVLAAAGLLASCTEQAEGEVNITKCDEGIFVGVIQDSIFEPVKDDNVTHQMEQCFGTESCVLVYGTTDHYACSEYSKNVHIKCNGEKIDATTNNEHCGSCDNACSGNTICQSGKCVEKGSTPVCDPGDVNCTGGDKEPGCTKDELKCDESGKILLKCNDNGEWKQDQVCESGICSDKSCAEKVCDAGAKKCDEDGKTPLVCENNDWSKQDACEDICLEGNCVTRECTGNEVKCDETGKILLTCVEDKWQSRECGYACENNTCIDEAPLDTDGDGVIDEEDPCPYNPKVLEGSYEFCPVAVEGNVLYVYHAENFYDVIMILSGKGAYDPKYSKFWQVKNVEFKNDINLADLPNTSINAQECIINDLSIIADLNDAKIHGNGHRITSVAPDGKRCALSQPLFEHIHASEIKDLIIDFDVKNGHGLLANIAYSGNEISTPREVANEFDNVLENIIYSGTLSISARNNNDNVDNVGGLVGETRAYVVDEGKYAKPIIIKNCFADGVTINAPDSNNVGGLVGKTQGAEYTFTSDKIMKFDKITGKDHVGGVFGYDAFIPDNINLGVRYLQVSFDEIQGNSDVGGYIGVGSADHVVLVGKKILSTGAGIGGLIGYCNPDSDAGNFNCVVKDSAVQIGSIATTNTLLDSNIGGAIGISAGNKTSISNLLVRANTLSGYSTLGGAIGSDSSTYFEVNNANVRVDEISGIAEVGGFIGALSSDRSSASFISVFANLFSNSSYSLGGFGGKVITSPTSRDITYSMFATARFDTIGDECNRIWTQAVTKIITNYSMLFTRFLMLDDSEVAFDDEENYGASGVKPSEVEMKAEASDTIDTFPLATDCSGAKENIKFYVKSLPDLSNALDKLVEAVGQK